MPSIRRITFRAVLFAALAHFVSGAVAQSPYVPAELEDWREWVLHDQPEAACPLSAESRVCVWPGRLALTVAGNGARFSQSVEVFAESWFWLPGRRDTWPLSVTVNDRAAPVIERGGRPTVRLGAGRHAIEGRFEWTRRPETLAISSTTGLVSLDIDGREVARPRWSEDFLWIARDVEGQTEKAENRLLVTVYRTIQDGAPAYMKLTMQIEVSGDSREETIGQLVPAGFAPAHMSAPLPARLGDDGQLTIQARPGSWRFTFKARATGPLRELTFSPSGEHWPREEVWSFAADPRLRVVEASSASPVDPLQAGVPDNARNLPSFRMQAGDTLTLIERQRGASERESDRLTLQRKLWLDFDRAGYTAQDRISGVMVRDWRLDLGLPFELASARVADSAQGNNSLLVTRNPDDESLRGVEIRRPQIDVSTLARLDRSGGAVPVSGWQKRLDGVTTDLYLPPGHRLLYATGADTDRDSWLSQWNLLHFFLVMVIAVALWRMYSPALGAAALVAVSLSIHEFGAPLWSWLNLVVAFALVKYLPAGRLLASARTYRWLSIIAIVLLALPFAAEQLRMALYPQIEAASPPRARSLTVPDVMMQQAPPLVLEEQLDNFARGADTSQAEIAGMVEEGRMRKASSARRVVSRYDKDARVQTGPGVPDWTWHRYRLSWTGPVAASQATRLWIAPPWLTAIWRIAMVAFIFGVIAALLRRDAAKLLRSPTGANAVVALLTCAGLAALLQAPQAAAETPSAALLQELRSRLTAPPECAPDCVSIPRAVVRFDDRSLSVELIAHVLTDAALAIPGTAAGWRPETVRIDGRAAQSLRRSGDAWQLLLDAGVHRVALVGALPNSNAVSIAFPLVPYHVEVDGQGWEVTGQSEGRLSGGALTLIRQRSEDERSTMDAIDVEQFPAFVTVTRRLAFDLDWEVHTTVTRQTPPTAAINMRIPLLDGESVISENVSVEDTDAIVNLATGQAQFVWRSTLSRVPELTLTAASNKPWQEVWYVVVGASWRMQHAGVPQMNLDHSQARSWQPVFTPWPGETLAISISRPAAVEGPTLALDSATLEHDVGQRSTSSLLQLRYRATRGTQHAITLPPGSELIDVTHDDSDLNVALEGVQLRLPIAPGEHAYAIRWRSESGSDFYTEGPRPDLGVAASNLSTRIVLPANRWAVWTRGPTLGPAVLYWSELVVFVLVALVLARIARTPLRFVQWLLLGLGFSTFFWPAFALVAIAILAHSWRATHSLEKPLAFNVVQLALAASAIAAGLALVTTIPLGLLGTPDMHIVGNHSHGNYFQWFADKSNGAFPATGVVSLPLWVYKGLILVWALWLAFAVLGWLSWMWQAFSRDGYWKAWRPLLETSANKKTAEKAE